LTVETISAVHENDVLRNGFEVGASASPRKSPWQAASGFGETALSSREKR